MNVFLYITFFLVSSKAQTKLRSGYLKATICSLLQCNHVIIHYFVEWRIHIVTKLMLRYYQNISFPVRRMYSWIERTINKRYIAVLKGKISYVAVAWQNRKCNVLAGSSVGNIETSNMNFTRPPCTVVYGHLQSSLHVQLIQQARTWDNWDASREQMTVNALREFWTGQGIVSRISVCLKWLTYTFIANCNPFSMILQFCAQLNIYCERTKHTLKGVFFL